jgi:hypothetical protein
MRVCCTGNLEISKGMTKVIARCVHPDFVAGHRESKWWNADGGGRAVAKMAVLRSNVRSVRLINHCPERTVIKPAAILVQLFVASLVFGPFPPLTETGGKLGSSSCQEYCLVIICCTSVLDSRAEGMPVKRGP